jgi:hypothetical protein
MKWLSLTAALVLCSATVNSADAGLFGASTEELREELLKVPDRAAPAPSCRPPFLPRRPRPVRLRLPGLPAPTCAAPCSSQCRLPVVRAWPGLAARRAVAARRNASSPSSNRNKAARNGCDNGCGNATSCFVPPQEEQLLRSRSFVRAGSVMRMRWLSWSYGYTSRPVGGRLATEQNLIGSATADKRKTSLETLGWIRPRRLT